MSRYSGYQRGDYLAICDRCGFKFLRSQMRLDWEHFLVCLWCYEVRHPQDIVPPSRVDRQWVPEPRDRQPINNFSGWIVTDPNDVVVKNGTEFNAFFAIEGLWDGASPVLAQSDWSEDYFSGDFELRTRLRTYNDADVGLYSFAGVAQDVATLADLQASGYALGWKFAIIAGQPVFAIEEYDNGSVYSTALAGIDNLLNRDIGVSFRRRENDLVLQIFSDTFFRKLAHERIVAMAGNTGQAYRYLYPINADLSASGNQHFDISYIFVELR